MPPELPLINRPHSPASTASQVRFEGDLDAAILDDPPAPPKVKRPGRPVEYDREQAREQAEALLRDGKLRGVELAAWAMWIAGLPLRQIVAEVAPGRSTRWLRDQVLGPLLHKAGIPTSWRPKKPRPTRTGLKYRKRQNPTDQGSR